MIFAAQIVFSGEKSAKTFTHCIFGFVRSLEMVRFYMFTVVIFVFFFLLVFFLIIGKVRENLNQNL